MALPQVGVEAVIANLSGFKAGADSIGKAYDTITAKAGQATKASEQMGLRFSEASGRWHAASGRFASTSELAAAGVQNVKKSIDAANKSADTGSRNFGNFGGVLNGLKASATSIAPHFVSIGQSVLNFGAIAGGAALLGVGALTAGIGALGIAALGEVAKFERMSLSIQNLVAREISQGQVVEQQAQARIQLTQKEVAELEKLKSGLDNEANDRDILTARIQEQKERIRQLTEQYGENGLVVIKERAELQGMELNLADLNGEIDTHNKRISELTSKNGQLTTVLQKVRVGQMSMTEAMELASPRAQELIKWIQMLAIQSPFNSEDIQMAFQTALAYGFTSEQAQRLTEAEVDFIAATGKTAQSADLIALALGQIQARGKLSAQELRQLSEQGVGVNKILEDMGFSLDDVTNGLVPVDKFLEAVIKDMEVFKGAAKEQATTFAGLITSLGEIKSVALREFFTGTFKSIQPYLAQFVDFLTKAALQTGSIKEMGNAIGEVVGGGLAKIAEWITIISELGAGGGLSILNELFGPAVFPLWRELSDLVSKISLSFSGVGASLVNLMPSFSQLSAVILPAITTALAFVNDHFEEFKGALLGVGAVLGAGVFAAIVAGILSLVTPISLIVAGAALLGAAWAGNWGGIQEKTFATWAVIQPILQQIYDWLAVNIPIAVQIMTDFWNNTLFPIFDMLKQRADLVIFTFEKFGASQGFAMLGKQVLAVIGTMIPGFTDVVNWLQINIPLAIQTVSNFWTGTLIPAYQMVSDFVTQILVPGFINITTWLTNVGLGIQSVATFWTGIFLAAATTIWNYLSTNIFPLFQAISDFQQAVWNKAIEATAGLWQNVLYPALLVVGGYIGTQLSPAITGLTVVWNILKVAFISLGNYLNSQLAPTIKTTGDTTQKIGKIISEEVIPVVEALASVTLGLLIEGLKDVTKWIKEATSFFKGLANAVENFQLPEVLQPGSPPPFAIALDDIANAAGRASLGVGKFQRLLTGIDTSSGEFLSAASKIMQRSINFTQSLHMGGVGNIAQMARNVFTQFTAQIVRSGEAGQLTAASLQTKLIDYLKLYNKNVPATLDYFRSQGLTFEYLAEQLNTSFGDFMRELRLQAVSEDIGLAGRFASFGQAVTERLNNEIETLQNIVNGETAYYHDQILTNVEAQELLNQKLEEQASVQKEINALAQQQADLQFLQQQVDIIKLVEERGLNAADIFQGITFGLGASLPDLIKATSNVVQAMIDQINSDLQMGSPSKIMVGIGKMIDTSLGKGLIDNISAPIVAARRMVEGVVSVASGQIMNGNSSTSTTNNNFNMNVSTVASPQAVMAQYQVMRAMV